MRKTIKVIIKLMKLNLQTDLAYRTNTILLSLGSGLYNVGAILFIEFLFSKIPLITGWDKWDLIFLYGVAQIFAYLYIFSSYRNIHSFNDKVRTGDFDIFLTKPTNSLIYSTLNSFAFDSLLSLTQPAVIIGYALINKVYAISIVGIIVAIIAMILTLVIVHLLSVITILPCFWATEQQFYRFFGETSDIMNYPYEILDNKVTRFIFFVIIPYALLINVPFRAIIGKLDYRIFLLQITVCIGFVIVTKTLWNFSLNRYQSASS
jgi:ABC-2 type transport system permease protein